MNSVSSFSLESFIDRYQLTPKTATDPLLQLYEVQEAFQKYLLHKIDCRIKKEGEPLEPILDMLQKELKTCFLIPGERLNHLAYLVHTTSAERELLRNTFETSDLNQSELQSHLKETLSGHPLNQQKKEIEKMEQDLAKIPEASPFKQYLVTAGALDKKGHFPKEGSSIENKQKIRYALHYLSRVLNIEPEEGCDLKTWNEEVSKVLYVRFLDVLAKGKYDTTAKTKFERINKSKKSYEPRVQETIDLLNGMTGVSGIQKLKDVLSIKVEEKDLADFPGVGLTWNPNRPLLEQRDESFNALCLETLLEISHKRGINIDHEALCLVQKRGDFSGLKDAVSQMPKLGERVRDKVVNLRSELGMQPSSDESTYDLYCSFKKEFKERYVAFKEKAHPNALQSLLLEEVYLRQEISQLLKIERELPRPVIEVVASSASSSPTNTTEETDSVDSTTSGNPEPHLVENFQIFKDWIAQQELSVLGHFVLQKRLLGCEGEEPQLLDMARFTVDLYIDQLKLEASMLKEPFPDKFSSLEDLEALSVRLAYKKFLRGLIFAQNNFKKKKDSECPVLEELDKISSQELSIQEIRVLSIQTLKGDSPQVHLEKLLQYLISLFNAAPSQSSAEINLDAFSSQKTKMAGFKWLFESSFLKSLEVDIGTRSQPTIEKAIRAFRKKMKEQIEDFDVPPIYLSILDDFIKNGKVDGLKRLFYEVAYQRYVQAITTMEYDRGQTELDQLLDFDAALENPSTVERVEWNKKKVHEIVKDKDLLHCLLFHLEQLPYDLRETSEESKHEISDYLQRKNPTGPFALYLQKSHFSWLGYDEEPWDWFCYLYEQFIKQITSDAQRSKYETIQLLALELEKLEPFDLLKLDQIATLIPSKQAVTVQDLYRFGFVWSVEEALKIPQCEKNHQSNFESIEDISIQVALLDKLSRSLALSHLVHSTIIKGNTRSLHVGYEFFKEVMKQPGISGNKGALSSFFSVHFLGYSDEWITYISKEEEDEIKKLEELEALMQGDLSDSPLKAVLEKEGVINLEGRAIGLYSLMPLHKLEPYIRGIKAFIDMNSGSLCPSPYLGLDSWKDMLISMNKQLVEREEEAVGSLVSCWQAEVDQLIEGALSDNVLGSFSDCLRNIGIQSMLGMGSDEYYHQYLIWESQAFQYFVGKLAKLEKKKNELFDNLNKTDKSIQVLTKVVNVLVNAEMTTDLVKSLKGGIQKRDWKAVNAITDQIIYIEYRITLIEQIIIYHQTAKNKYLCGILPQIEEVEGSYRAKIEDSLNNPPTFLSSENQDKLKAILGNESWIEKHKSSIKTKWNWALDKVYLKSFSDIHLDPSTLTLYEKQAILDNICCELATSLLKEVQELGMHEGYREFIKTAHYEDCTFLWDWVVEDVSYQKCLSKIEEARNEGADMSMFDDLEEKTRNYVTYQKTPVVLQTLKDHADSSSACKTMLSSIEQHGFFTINPYSLTKGE